MIKSGKMRTSVWVDPRLLMLLSERGLTLSSFIGRSLPLFLELPDDPTKKLIQDDLQNTVLRLRSTYIQEMEEIKAQEAKRIRAAQPVKMVHVFDLTDETYRDIPESQFDPQWHKIREKRATA